MIIMLVLSGLTAGNYVAFHCNFSSDSSPLCFIVLPLTLYDIRRDNQ